jgi:hypothetical protein
MLVRFLRGGGGGNCADGKTCPALHRTDRGTLVVQGWTVADSTLLDRLGLPGGTQAVEVPADLLAEVIDSWPASRRTGRGTLIVTGTAVTDPDALRQLRLPPTEQAVEVPASLLSKVVEAC